MQNMEIPRSLAPVPCPLHIDWSVSLGFHVRVEPMESQAPSGTQTGSEALWLKCCKPDTGRQAGRPR